MKSIFATALVAATATALNAKAVPDYIAGWVYGMTGDNHLTELESCFNSSHDLAEEAHSALADIKSGDWFKGIAAVRKIVNEFPATVTTCKNMDDDLARIQAWANIFTEPEHLFKEASKNYLLHRKTIHDDIASEQAHWAAGQYFNAGIDTALALTEILPIDDLVTVQYMVTPHKLEMPVLAAPKFAAGLVFGMVEENQLAEIETCAKDGHSMIPAIEAAIKDLESGDWVKGVEDILALVHDVKTLLSDCHNMDDNIAAIEAWASLFQNKAKLVAVVTKNMALHKKAVQADIADAKAAWALNEYFSAGVTCADIAVKLVGPIKPVTQTPKTINEIANFDAMAIPDFLAGFIYGMTGDNDLTELEACYQGSKEINTMLQLAIDDLKKGGTDNEIQAALEFSLVALMFPQALKTCEGMDEDIAAIEEWAQVFSDPKKLTATVSKNYLLHKKKIDADIDACEADYAAQDWWQLGVDTAALATVAIGPITPVLPIF